MPVSRRSKKKTHKRSAVGESERKRQLLQKRQDARAQVVDKVVAAIAKASRMLVVRNLPTNATNEMLSVLFGQCAGFEDVHMKWPLAVVTYSDSVLCAAAKEAVRSFEWWPGRKIDVGDAPPDSGTDAVPDVEAE